MTDNVQNMAISHNNNNIKDQRRISSNSNSRREYNEATVIEPMYQYRGLSITGQKLLIELLERDKEVDDDKSRTKAYLERINTLEI